MKLPQKQTSKKRIILIASIVVLALLLGGGTYYFVRQSASPQAQPAGAINYNPPTQEEKQETEQQKEEIIKEQVTPTPPSTTLHASITRVFQDPQGINVRAVVDGTKDGQCEVTLSKTGQTAVVKTFNVVFEATTASCHQALIPLSEIPASGTWDVSVVIKKEGASSAPATTTVDVTK